MLTELGIHSYLAPAVGYLLLTALLVISWRGQAMATLAVVASFASTLWAAMAVAYSVTPLLPAGLFQLSELVRTGLWCLLLLNLLEHHLQSRQPVLRNTLHLTAVSAATVMVVLPLLASPLSIELASVRALTLVVSIALASNGLLLVARIYRSALPDQRWSMTCLSLGLGAVLASDIFLYADSLLARQMDWQIWQARGVINALAVPLIAVSLARNLSEGQSIQVSRHVIFHSCMLMGTGLYLIMMAVCGYLIRLYGGSWGGVTQVLFLCLSGSLLLVLLFSDRIRAKVRVFLSKHFFSYKYDYRQEWSRFTQNLSSSEVSVPHRVVTALAGLVKSNSGLLWLRQENGYELLECWNSEAPSKSIDESLAQVTDFCERQQWVIDIEEYLQNPGFYPALELTDALLERKDAWLLIPLFFGDNLIGLVLLAKSDVPQSMNWEDRDLLKVAGRQAASELAQYKFNQELVQARQFEAFNRLSAYVAHDLKNILAQQSLIVSNAEQHKHNPAFVDDVVGTVQNSVNRMKRLMEQMRSGARAVPAGNLKINELLQTVVDRHSMREPRPRLICSDEMLTAPADPEQLATVFGHIIQNAQEACSKDGMVEVLLEYIEDSMAVVSVKDNGVGMDADFVRERLFRPFDSTKGLTGMGVGAFESREYIRSLGGDIEVTSTPGAGSLFRIVIPCQPAETEACEWPLQKSTY